MSDVTAVVENAIESFSLDEFVSEASAPEDSVTIYLDAKTAYEIERLQEQHDEYVRTKGERKERKEPGSIVGDPEDEEMENIDLTLAELKERIKASGLTVHMRAVNEVERDLIGHKVVREMPFPKNATKEQEALIGEDRTKVTGEAWIAAAVTKIVRDRDGAVDESKKTQEQIAALHTALYDTEWNKLMAKFYELSFASALFDRATDAGFPGGGTVEA